MSITKYIQSLKKKGRSDKEMCYHITAGDYSDKPRLGIPHTLVENTVHAVDEVL